MGEIPKKIVRRKTVKGVIQQGIRLIQKYGHVKGRFGYYTSGFCASGACREAAFTTEVWNRAVDLLDRTVAEEGLYGSSIAYYNDRPQRTKEEVIDMMQKALARA